MSPVSQHPAASAAVALMHFSQRLSFETDCSDVHHSLQSGAADFVLLDVRNEAAYGAGHLPGAICLPHRQIDADRLAAFPRDRLFVVYCAGPHCNGVHRAAARIAGLGYAVKEMLGGVTGWLDEGLSLIADDERVVAATAAGVSCAC
jgi:rhodanese-related sulfurtransferase